MTPSVASASAAIGAPSIGPAPNTVQTTKATYIPSMTKSPWAKLTIFIMPPDQGEAGGKQRVYRAQQQSADDDLNKDGGHAARVLDWAAGIGLWHRRSSSADRATPITASASAKSG